LGKSHTFIRLLRGVPVASLTTEVVCAFLVFVVLVTLGVSAALGLVFLLFG
jgi:hypothetical protein